VPRYPSSRKATETLLSLLKCRRLLGRHADDLTDKKVRGIRRRLYLLAGIVSDAYAEILEDQRTSGPRSRLGGGEDDDT
jgi:hypothetical protein